VISLRPNLFAALLIAALAGACDPGAAPPVPDDTASFRARLVSDVDPADVAAIRVEVFHEGERVERRDVPLVEQPIPGEDATRYGGDAYFTLRPGDYLAAATPLAPDGEPAPGCARAEAAATVRRGETTEVVLIMVCGDDGSGGLDVVLGIEHPPVITDLELVPSKFIPACTSMSARVTVDDADGDLDGLVYEWSVLDSPGDAEFVLDADGQAAGFFAQTPGTYTLRVEVTDEAGQSAHLDFPVYVSADMGACSGEVDGLDAPIRVVLDRLVYGVADTVSVRVEVDADSAAEVIGVVLAAPVSEDIEVLTLRRAEAGVYTTDVAVPVTSALDEVIVPLDNRLALTPGETFFALYYVDATGIGVPGARENYIADMGLMRAFDPNDPNAVPVAPVQVMPALAASDDELEPAFGGKRVGTLARQGSVPLQLAIDELILAPRDDAELARFLAETGGTILRSAEFGAGDRAETQYLVRVDPAAAPLQDLPQLRALYGEDTLLFGSSPEALGIYALTLHYGLQGYRVGVNPRLQFQGTPVVSEQRAPGFGDTMNRLHPPATTVPDAWAFNALWDGDEARIDAAVLDMGFAPNADFRVPAGGMRQCDLEGGSFFGGLLRGIECRAGIAVGPPTVGNSFFGDRSWHGTGVVTVLGGIPNNGFGATGVAGQVAVPMLYRFGLASYAFEMGLGIQQAVIDGASVINLSAGYPCRILDNADIDFNICSPGGRAALCATITVALLAATELVCASAHALAGIPFVGPFIAAPLFAACAAGHAAVAAGITACHALVLAGDPRGPLGHALEFATERGVPVVSIAGNNINPDNLPPLVADIIDVDERRVEAWGIIPAMMPETIVVGAVNVADDFRNVHYFGDRVDLWAPIESSYWHPEDIDDVTSRQTGGLIGGTSAAAPYVAGTIALMQALNPTLNPRTPGLSPAARRAIPERLRALLAETATTNAELNAAGYVDGSGERGNVVNPFAAARAAALEVIPDFASLGYDAALNFDEDAGGADSADSAFVLAEGVTATGTILYMRGEGGAPAYRDEDFYRLPVAAELPPGLYVQDLRLRTPRGDLFDPLENDHPDFHLVGFGRPSATEDELLYESGPLLPGGSTFARVRGFADNDNVYQIVYGTRRVGDAPTADRFDRDDPAFNPPESRPDNDIPARAVRLGGPGEFAWISDGFDAAGGEIFAIDIPDLNFHDVGDEDYFAVVDLPPFDAYEGAGCQPSLYITFADGARLTATAPDGTVLLARQPSPVDIPSDWLALPLTFHLEAAADGGAISYDLRVEVRLPSERICALADLHRGIRDLAGSGFHEFPRFFPDVDEVDPNGLDPERELDPLGRVVTPDTYLVTWRGGDFRASVQLVRGDSIRVGLTDFEDDLLTEVKSRDPVAGDNHPPGPEFMVLSAPNLPAGDYLIQVSEGHLGSVLELILPANAISDGSRSFESHEAGPSGQD